VTIFVKCGIHDGKERCGKKAGKGEKRREEEALFPKGGSPLSPSPPGKKEVEKGGKKVKEKKEKGKGEVDIRPTVFSH